MEIKGKIYCFFEQSGTFKNEFRKLGYEAEDYDIQNEYGETDHICDLFAEIERGYDGKPSIFDEITPDDLVLAFFPCINFCDAKTMMFKGISTFQRGWSLSKIMRENVKFSQVRQYFFEILLKFVAICDERKIRLLIENPWNTSGETYLQRNFIAPTFIDKDRSRRGDYFVKPTAYWFVGCKNTIGYSEQKDKQIKIVYKVRSKKEETGVCNAARSEISPDYARNFICDFIIGKVQANTLPTLF